jgi:iron-sulfur cluster repair protein YtfE (RIC family)
VNPAEELRRQHFLVLRGVVLTHRIARRVRGQAPGCARDVEELLGFLRFFVLDFHIRLEEELVFPWMQAAHRMPLQVTLDDLGHEHRNLRQLTDEVDWAVHSDQPADSEELARTLEVHAGITEHHIRRENQILLPLFAASIADDTFALRFKERLNAFRPRSAQASELLEQIEARLPMSDFTEWH